MNHCLLCGADAGARGYGVWLQQSVKRWTTQEWGSLCIDCAQATAMKRNSAIRHGAPIEDTYRMLLEARTS